jgi:hypothetical protein
MNAKRNLNAKKVKYDAVVVVAAVVNWISWLCWTSRNTREQTWDL